MEIYERDNSVGGDGNDVQKLTYSQENLIIKRWNDNSQEPPSIDELLNIVFQNKELDGRSREGILIKKFLVEKGLKLNSTEKSKIFELTTEQKNYIENNCSTMKIMEMARTLFHTKISPSSLEVRALNSFIKTLNPKFLYDKEMPNNDYLAPVSTERAVVRIKKYVQETRDWDSKKLTPNQKKQVESLINYLGSYRFKYQIDSYEDREDKELFESSFVKYTYDKSDLSQENCDQYILLCTEIVNDYHIQKNIRMLGAEQDRVLQDEGKISMVVVEALKSWGEKHDKCVANQQKLYISLTEERSEKISKEIKDKASLLNLINAWKNYETRQQMLKLANEKKDELRKELHELETLEEMRMKILGLSVDEIVDG